MRLGWSVPLPGPFRLSGTVWRSRRRRRRPRPTFRQLPRAAQITIIAFAIAGAIWGGIAGGGKAPAPAPSVTATAVP